MNRFIAAVALIVLAAGVADAACVQRVARQPFIPATPFVATPLVFAAPSYVPVYGQGYPSQGQDEVLRRLLEVLDRIEAKLDGGPQRAAAELYPFHEVAQQACIKCHQGAKAKGDFQLFDDAGKFVEPSRGDKRAIYARVVTDDPKLKMPPTGKLQPVVVRAIADWTNRKELPAPAVLPKKE
jgi:hypothetical protein